ncbi:MAG: response regulator [Alphaproteobacteria bacterium]|nr:response regulator [Alphaproteobacteria bacterium]
MRTCLVADDSAVIRKVARRIIEGLDFQVVEAEDGAMALDLCRRHMPDVVLLDGGMPVMDGYEFLRHMRHLMGGNRPAVIFCTTENDIAQMARARHIGATGHLVKPFDGEIVTAKFRELGLVA